MEAETFAIYSTAYGVAMAYEKFLDPRDDGFERRTGDRLAAPGARQQSWIQDRGGESAAQSRRKNQ